MSSGYADPLTVGVKEGSIMSTDVSFSLGYIETFAGNGKARSTGDGKRAAKAGIPLPNHVALDKLSQRA